MCSWGWHTPLKSPLHHHYRQHLPINICVGKGGVRAKKSKGTDHCDGQSLPHTHTHKKNKTKLISSIPTFHKSFISLPFLIFPLPGRVGWPYRHHHPINIILITIPSYSYSQTTHTFALYRRAREFFSPAKSHVFWRQSRVPSSFEGTIISPSSG